MGDLYRISFQQLFILASKRDWQPYKTSVYYLNFWIKLGQWILMVGEDTCVADLLDIVHHEMDSMFQSPVIEQLILEKKLTGQFTHWICSGSDKGFSDSGLHSIGKIIHRSCGIFYMKGLYCLCHIPGRRRKEKA